MQARANKSMYWPGINNHIKTFSDNCKSCSYNVPSQSKEPLISFPQPEWPFQQICGDYFDSQGHSYLAIVDRFSGWLCLHHFKPGSATSQNLITSYWSLFMNYGVPEEFSSDGGPQFTSTSFQNFLKKWGVNIDSHQWATHNSVVEMRLQLKLLNISSRTIHPRMDR